MFFPFWGSLEDTCSRRVLSEIKSVSQPFSGSWQLLVGFASALPWVPSSWRLLRSWLSWSAGRACSPWLRCPWTSTRLNLAGLYKLLLAECSSRDRKDLSYLGGIRLSPEDVGWPAPYAAVESYDLADGSRQLTRDPGDALWAEVFDLLPGAQESTALKVLSADRKGDCLELTLGAAAALLDVDPREGKAGPPASQELLQCLHCARLLLEDLARTSEELREDGVEVRGSKNCPKCGGVVFGRWRYMSGALKKPAPGPAATRAGRTHVLPIQKRYAELIAAGAKTIEGHLNCGVAALVKAGDRLRLGSAHCKVAEVERYASFGEMLRNTSWQAAIPDVGTLQEALDVYHSFANYEDLAQRGEPLSGRTPQSPGLGPAPRGMCPRLRRR